MIFVEEFSEKLADTAAASVTTDHHVRYSFLHLEIAAVVRALKVRARVRARVRVRAKSREHRPSSL
jgi:hypothetical protein